MTFVFCSLSIVLDTPLLNIRLVLSLGQVLFLKKRLKLLKIN